MKTENVATNVGRACCALAFVLSVACGAETQSPSDASKVVDASVADGGAEDAGVPPDAGDVDAGTSGLPDTIETGSYPNGIAANAEHIFVVIGETHSNPNSLPLAAGQTSVVQVYSARDGSLVKEIPVPGGGHSLRMMRNGEKLYVAHFSMDHLVTAISTSTLEVVASIGGLPGIAVPDALSISHDDRYVYVGNNGLNTGWISRIDTVSDTVDPGWRVTVEGGYTCWVETSPILDVLYANSWTGGTVQRKDITSQSSETTMAVGDFPHAVALDPTGTFVYAFVSGGNAVRKLDGQTLDVITEVPGPYAGLWGGPVSGLISASGRHIFVANHAAGSVAVLDIDPASATYDTVVGVRTVGADPIFQALSADGTRLFVANNESSTISVIDVSEFE